MELSENDINDLIKSYTTEQQPVVRLLFEMINHGQELAEYASYAEIVGKLGINQSPIRKECDILFERFRRLQDLIEDDNEEK